MVLIWESVDDPIKHKIHKMVTLCMIQHVCVHVDMHLYSTALLERFIVLLLDMLYSCVYVTNIIGSDKLSVAT